MPTLGDLKAEIADDIDDTTGEYTDQIERAISGAIRYCERSVYYFNETRDITFPTVDGQEWYGEADNANIPTLVRIDAAWSEDSGGQRSALDREPPEVLEGLSDNSSSRGEPYAFTYFARQIRLYPIPGAQVYTIRLQVGPYRLAPMVNDSDENAWLTEAYDLIKARAKYLVYKNTLKEAALAAEALNDANDQHDALKAETSARSGTGRIVPTCF